MKIELYTRDSCSLCVRAKDLLNSKKIDYIQYEIDKDSNREEIMTKYPAAKTLPFVLIDGEWIGGYFQLEEYLKNEN